MLFPFFFFFFLVLFGSHLFMYLFFFGWAAATSLVLFTSITFCYYIILYKLVMVFCFNFYIYT